MLDRAPVFTGCAQTLENGRFTNIGVWAVTEPCGITPLMMSRVATHDLEVARSPTAPPDCRPTSTPTRPARQDRPLAIILRRLVERPIAVSATMIRNSARSCSTRLPPAPADRVHVRTNRTRSNPRVWASAIRRSQCTRKKRCTHWSACFRSHCVRTRDR